MPGRILRLALLSCAALMLASSSSAQETVFFIVRHAEKESSASDAPLSMAGKGRAKQLMQTLEHLRVEAIYHTDYVRTRDTAKPLAEQLRITPEKYAEPSETWLKEVLAKQKGKRMLVVGHSNTVPLILRGLTGGTFAEIPDKEFDNLFVVTVSSEKTAVVRLKYGTASR